MNEKEIVEKLISTHLNKKEKDELIDMLFNNKTLLNVEKEKLSFGDKMADKISLIAGSWKFIIIISLFLILWIILNLFIIDIDPYPFILLNLLLSCVAAIQAPIIMMSQNRASKKDSKRNQNDYITDLKSELILEDLYNKTNLILKKLNNKKE